MWLVVGWLRILRGHAVVRMKEPCQDVQHNTQHTGQKTRDPGASPRQSQQPACPALLLHTERSFLSASRQSERVGAVITDPCYRWVARGTARLHNLPKVRLDLGPERGRALSSTEAHHQHRGFREWEKGGQQTLCSCLRFGSQDLQGETPPDGCYTTSSFHF